MELPNKSVIRNVNLRIGKCGLINFTYYTCLISIHSDRQSKKCLMWELENESKGLEERTAFLNAFVATLLALDLTDSELNYIFKNLESTGRANVWSSKNNKYIVVISVKNSFKIFASDRKLF